MGFSLGRMRVYSDDNNNVYCVLRCLVINMMNI